MINTNDDGSTLIARITGIKEGKRGIIATILIIPPYGRGINEGESAEDYEKFCKMNLKKMNTLDKLHAGSITITQSD